MNVLLSIYSTPPFEIHSTAMIYIYNQLKELSRQHPAYLEDTRHFLSYIDGVNKEIGPFDKEKLWFISRDIVNYYPSCGTEMCLKAVGQ